MRRKMKRKIGIILLAAALLSGCSQEVVTVAGTLSEEGEKPEAYIEMQEFELKEPPWIKIITGYFPFLEGVKILQFKQSSS